MILIALGANLPSARFGPPRATLAAALDELAKAGVVPQARSSWYESEPVPPSDQPWFINAVARVETPLAPAALMATLHDVEAMLGRQRGAANAARAVDLDLLDYHGAVTGADAWPRLPHPRLVERAFVVLPLAELVPDWRHPVGGRTVADLAACLPPDPACRRAEAPTI